jgi:hypothetical protein
MKQDDLIRIVGVLDSVQDSDPFKTKKSTSSASAI